MTKPVIDALRLLPLFLLASCALQASEKCKSGDTFAECWHQYHPVTAPRVVQTGEFIAEVKTESAGVTNELKSKETGLDGGSQALATTTRNFLPLLAATGLVADSDGDSENQLFALDLNFLIPALAKDKNAQLKAVLNTDPKMFDPLKKAFDTATGSTDRSGALQKDLSASDDFTVSFTYSHINKNFGRGFQQYQRRFSNLFEAAITIGSTGGEATARADHAMVRLMSERGIDSVDAKLTDQQSVDAVEAAARGELHLEQNVRKTMIDNHLSRFADLVNNQPQLTFSAEIHKRDPLAGPNESSFKLSYEFGLANVSRFNSLSDGVCDLLDLNVIEIPTNQAKLCLDTFRKYVEDNEQRLDNADRFSLELSYVKVDDYDFASPDDGVTLARAGSKHLDVGLGYGRTLRALGKDRDSRIDLVAKYEDYSDDVDHKDRLVATLTFTTKLNGMSIPFSLVYANHEKFLPESDDQLSAHIGIKYQLDPKE